MSLSPRVKNDETSEKYPFTVMQNKALKSAMELINYQHEEQENAIYNTKANKRNHKEMSEFMQKTTWEIAKEIICCKQEEQEDHKVDYDKNTTELYKLIESKEWKQVLQRLQTNPEEASIWVVRYDTDDRSKVLWKMLPIHAVCYPQTTHGVDGPIICGIRAENGVIKQLLQVYPDGAKMKDDNDMTPLHLASRNGASLYAIRMLFDAYPMGTQERDYKGRTPLELAEATNSLNKERIVAFLIEQKINKNSETRFVLSPLGSPSSVHRELFSFS